MTFVGEINKGVKDDVGSGVPTKDGGGFAPQPAVGDIPGNLVTQPIDGGNLPCT